MVSPLNASSLFLSVSNAKEQPGGESDIQAVSPSPRGHRGENAMASGCHGEVRFGGCGGSDGRWLAYKVGEKKVGGTQGPHAQPGTSLYTHSSI